MQSPMPARATADSYSTKLQKFIMWNRVEGFFEI